MAAQWVSLQELCDVLDGFTTSYTAMQEFNPSRTELAVCILDCYLRFMQHGGQSLHWALALKQH